MEKNVDDDTDSKYTVKVAEPGVDTLPLATDHDHVDRNGSKSTAAAKVTSVAPSAPKPTMSKIMLKPPSDVKPPVEEKAKASEETQKGLFRAHLEGKAPYTKEVKKKHDKDGDFPWLLPVLAGAVAVAGGILGLVLWKKRDDRSPRAGGVRGFIESGKQKLKKFRGSSDSSSSDSESDNESVFHSGGVYNVKEGDNLTKIAKRHGKQSWREIAVQNPSIDNPDLIYPGDRLKL